MKTYREHNCARKHRTYAALAKCMFPRAAWVHGEGSYACLARCNVLTVVLWATEEDANKRKADIDRGGCGGFCKRQHELVLLAR